MENQWLHAAGPDGGKPTPEEITKTNETYFLIKGGKLVGGASAEPTLLFNRLSSLANTLTGKYPSIQSPVLMTSNFQSLSCDRRDRLAQIA